MQVAKIVVGVGAPPVEREQSLVRRNRFILQAEPVVRGGEQVPAVRIAGPGAQQLFEQVLCRALVAAAQQLLRFSESGRGGGDACAAPAGPG